MVVRTETLGSSVSDHSPLLIIISNSKELQWSFFVYQLKNCMKQIRTSKPEIIKYYKNLENTIKVLEAKLKPIYEDKEIYNMVQQNLVELEK